MGLIYPHIVNLLKNALAVQGRFLFLNLVVVFTAAADITYAGDNSTGKNGGITAYSYRDAQHA